MSAVGDPAGLARLRDRVLAYAPVPPAQLDAFLGEVRVRSYEPGSFFTLPGDTHDRVGFVLEGLFRVYYTGEDGGVRIRNFCHEGKPLGSYATILAGLPAHVAIEALEPSRVAEFPYAALARRFEEHAAWERVGRLLAEEHYVARERREFEFLTLGAAERYEAFRQAFPGLDARLKRRDVASYVGVEPETFSRLLSRAKKPR